MVLTDGDVADPEDRSRLNSYIGTLMILTKAFIGTGVFAMGDAIKNSGLILGPFLMILLAIICVYASHVLCRLAERMKVMMDLTESPEYAEMVSLSFENGRPGAKKYAHCMRIFIDIFMCVMQLGFCTVYLIFIGTSTKQVFDRYLKPGSLNLHIAIVMLVALPFCLIENIKYLTPVSIIANILMIGGIIMTFYFLVNDFKPMCELNMVSSLEGSPLFFGTAIFGFIAVAMIIPLYNNMRVQRNYVKPFGVLNICMVIVAIINIMMGVFSYLKYGNDVKGSVSFNIPEDKVLAQIVKLAVGLSILLTYPVQFFVPGFTIWTAIFHCTGPFKGSRWARYGLLTGLVLLTYVLAIAMPFVDIVISLLGALGGGVLALIIPPMCEMVMEPFAKTKLANRLYLAGNIVLIIVGAVGCLTGAYASIRSLVVRLRQ